MPGKTKSFWLKRQQQLRGRSNAVKRQILREWDAKSPDERTIWVEAYQRAVDADEKCLKRKTAAKTHVQAAKNLHGVELTDADAFIEFTSVFANAKAAVTARREAEVERRAAWEELHQLDQSQPTPNQLNIDDDAASIQSAQAKINKCDHQLQWLKNDRDFPPIPKDALGVRRMPRHWVNGRRAQRHREGEELGFGIGMSSGPFDGWQAKRTISGGMGTATVFVRLDGIGKIVDRVVRKDVFLNERAWKDPALWKGDIRDNDIKVHYEQACHNALMGVANLDNVIKLRDSFNRNHIFNEALKYRLYQEYAPHGTLSDLMKAHRKEKILIPEPFVWYVAQSLAEAGIAMQYGLLDPEKDNTERAEGWEEIVHRDLKPNNVLLARSSNTRWQRYPKPALTDFGIAFMTSDTDPTNPRWYNTGGGTFRYLAPEQQRWVDRDDLHPVNEQRLGSWTNAFGVGLILRCLVTLESPPEALWLGNENDDETLLVDDDWPSDQYSDELITLINECLQFDRHQRPTFQAILDAVHTELATQPGPSHDLANNVASIATRHQNRVLEKADMYAIDTVPPAGIQEG